MLVYILMSLEGQTTETINVILLWGVVSYRVVGKFRIFEGTCCLKMEDLACLET
jgi:hypothetical protein